MSRGGFGEYWETRGWGFGVSMVTRRDELWATPGRYGWDGGYGTAWANDPREELIGILMTQQLGFPQGSRPPRLLELGLCGARRLTPVSRAAPCASFLHRLEIRRSPCPATSTDS